MIDREPSPRPTSKGQEALWFLHRLPTIGTTYHLSYSLRMRGPLDLEELRGALDEVVERHEPLRTIFPEDGGRCSPRVLPPGPVALATHEVGDDAAAIRRRATRAPFDLATGPVIRADLLRHGEVDHELVLTIHHIACDGHSEGLLKRELAEGYTARRLGRSPILPDLPRTYAEVEAARRRRGEAARAACIEAWRTDLEGASDPLLLPLARRKVAQEFHAGAVLTTPLEPSLVAALEARACADGTTVGATMLAAYQVLLGRWSGREDFLVGVPVAGRGDPAARDLIGYFVNTLPVPARLGASTGFRELATRAHAGIRAAKDRQDVPLSALVEALEPDRGLSRSALFQTFFQVRRGVEDPPALTGLETEWTCLDPGGAIMDLALQIDLDRGGARVSLDYATDLIDADAAEELSWQYLHILRYVAARRDPAWRRIQLLDEAGRRRALAAGRGRRSPYPRDRTLGELVSEQAAIRPDAPALSDGEVTRSYAEVWDGARRVAGAVRARGVEPGNVVAVVADRTLPTLEALVGVVAAGGAYLPLDPEEPAPRREAMLDAASVELVIGAAHRHPVASGRTFLALEEAALATPVVGPTGPPEGVAYVMFTSGTTGTPKGVVVPHQAIVRLVHDPDFVRLDPESVITQLENLCFDGSTSSIWGALLKGGRLEVVAREDMLDPSRFGEVLRTHGVTVVGLNASLFSVLARYEPGVFRGLESLIVGGEAVRPEDVVAVRRAGCAGRILQDYGPTEATCVAAYHVIEGEPDPRRRLAIGRPLANTDLHVLDEAMGLVPPGVVGELFVGGDALARGYLDPELTAARFVQDPFSERPGARLYRTGDLAVRRPDGAHVLLGRRDRQVKLRGHRIEIGEVEAAAADAPGVGACAAALRTVAGAPTLVLWVVASDGAAPDAGAISRSLAARLPGFMCPGHVVVVDHLPRARLGKLDLAALPDPRPAAAVEGPPAQMQGTEGVVERIWRRVLGPVDLRPDSNWFALGGNSLKIIELLAAVERELGVRVTVADFMRDSTVSGLAEQLELQEKRESPGTRGRLDEAAEAKEFDRLIRVVRAWEGNRARPDSLVVGRNADGSRRTLFWCLQGEQEHAALARHLGPEVPVYAMRSGHRILERYHEMLPALARRYASEIMEVDPIGPYLLGGNCQGGLIAFQTALELWRRGRRVALLLLLEIMIEEPYPGRVALIYGRESQEENPYNAGPAPDPIFERNYRSYSVDIIPGNHGKFFRSPIVEGFTAALRRRTMEAEERLADDLEG